MSKIAIIGGGAAGLLAGITLAQNGADVTIFEKMHQAGKKMLITGKGRCNITNACDIQGFIKNLPGNGRFLNSALHRFTNDDIVELLEDNGLQTKVERGGRIFPVTDKAKDVVDTLIAIFRNAGGILRTDTKIIDILLRDDKVVGVKTVNGVYGADAIVLAAGGASYPGTGSDGNGAKLAAKVGHNIIPLRPSLVPLESDHPYIDALQGLSLRNVQGSLLVDGKKIASEFGEMLFTHFGVSGPIVLSLSNAASRVLQERKTVDLCIDLKPALSIEKLDARVQRDFLQYSRKQLANGMKDLLPQSMIPVVCDMAYLDEEKPINQISKEERQRLVHTLKNFCVPITATRPISEAIVTAGGVDVKEINPKTMESKIVEGLYFAGEVMDVDGFTGGFNLQAAFSSGYAAGIAINDKYNNL